MKKGVRIFLFLAVCLLLMEITCRVYAHFRPFSSDGSWKFPYYPEFDRKDGRGMYYAHPYSSYEFKPNGRSDINDEGFRAQQTYGKKTPGSIRIVCIGSSTTFGIRNSFKHAYPFLLEQKLKEQMPGRNIEVINAGLVSATTVETIHRMCFKVIPLEPDLVIVYEGFNDLVPRIADHFENDYGHFRKIPLKKGYELFRWLNRSYLVLLIKRWMTGVEDLYSYIHNEKNIPADEAQKRANFKKNGPEYFARNMELIIKILRAYDIIPVVPTFAFMPGLQDGWVKAFPDSLWKEGIEQNNEILRDLAAKYRLPSVDYYAFAAKHLEIFSGKIHMNDRGNHFMAQFIANQLLADPVARARLMKGSSGIEVKANNALPDGNE